LHQRMGRLRLSSVSCSPPQCLPAPPAIPPSSAPGSLSTRVR
jgi:hypothetical protein